MTALLPTSVMCLFVSFSALATERLASVTSGGSGNEGLIGFSLFANSASVQGNTVSLNGQIFGEKYPPKTYQLTYSNQFGEDLLEEARIGKSYLLLDADQKPKWVYTMTQELSSGSLHIRSTSVLTHDRSGSPVSAAIVDDPFPILPVLIVVGAALAFCEINIIYANLKECSAGLKTELSFSIKKAVQCKTECLVT